MGANGCAYLKMACQATNGEAPKKQKNVKIVKRQKKQKMLKS